MTDATSRRLATAAVGLVLLASAVLAACAGGSSNGASDEITTTAPSTVPTVPDSEYEDLTASSEVTIEAVDNTYRPQYATIRRGTTVTFVNDGRTEHNVIPTEPGQFEPIEAAQFAPDQSATRTFDEVGLVPYYCSLHGTATKGMVGGLRVVD